MMIEVIRDCEADEDNVMTKTMRAWRRANAYVQSGQHDKAIFWLCRTVEILEAGPPKPSRLKHIDPGYVLAALFLLVLLWAAKV